MSHISKVSTQLPVKASTKGDNKECTSLKDDLGLCTETKEPI